MKTESTPLYKHDGDLVDIEMTTNKSMIMKILFHFCP